MLFSAEKKHEYKGTTFLVQGWLKENVMQFEVAVVRHELIANQKYYVYKATENPEESKQEF